MYLASCSQLNIHLLACGRLGWEVDREWPVKRLKQHRLLGSNLQYLVEWDGLDHHEQPWPDTWEFEANIGSFHLNAYTRRLTSIESKMVSVDLQPVMYSTRKSVAHAVAIAKTQCRPRIHFLEIDMLNLQALGMAFLEIVQFPGKLLLSTNKSQRKIPIKETKGKDGVHSYSVTYDKIEDVAAFCQFEHHVSSQSGAPTCTMLCILYAMCVRYSLFFNCVFPIILIELTRTPRGTAHKREGAHVISAPSHFPVAVHS